MIKVKWKLMFLALPYAAGAVICKLILFYFVKFEGIVALSDIALLVSAGVFLLGFMLAGVMSDYKESERIPGEIASAIESLEETCTNLATKTNYDLNFVRKGTLDLATSVHEWFLEKISDTEIFERLTRFNLVINELDRIGAAATILGRLFNEMSILRRIVTRAGVISRTGFLATGYALLETLIVVIFAILMIVKFAHIIGAVVVTFFITLVYVYMYRLISDIDDPFEYGEEEGSAEVPLFPLTEYIERVEKRINSHTSDSI